MKHIILILTIIMLFPAYSFAGFVCFPGNEDEYRLEVYESQIKIFSTSNTNLPICRESGGECTGYEIITATANDGLAMATRNAWIATLLNAEATGNKVAVFYDNDGIINLVFVRGGICP